MEFWENSIVRTLLSLAALLGVGALARHAWPALRRVGLPASIIAGSVGLVIGPGLLGWAPLDVEVLKAGVYHALGIVLIAVGLQKKDPRAGDTSDGKSMAFAITALAAFQTLVGLLVILVLGVLVASHYHPGMGLIFSIGFQQGPGQALALGSTWEKGGMVDGADVGLIVAAVGFVWSVCVGVPLVAWGKARGLIPTRSSEDDALSGDASASKAAPAAAGALDPLARQLVVIGLIYALTLAACTGLSLALGGQAPVMFDATAGISPDDGKRTIADSIWGFHFMVGALIAMAVRPLLSRGEAETTLDSRLLGRISGVTVDFATVAALSAVQISVLGANWLPILVLTTIGGAVTLVFVVWFSRRAFQSARFEHCVLLFGMATGTLPMGLALLRIIDPEMKSPAPRSAVIGSAGAIIGVAPVLIVIHNIALNGWSGSYPAMGWLTVGVSLLYLCAAVFLWRRFGGLRSVRPHRALWPRDP